MILRKSWLVGALIVCVCAFGAVDYAILRVLDAKTDSIVEMCAVNDARLRWLEGMAH